MAHLGAYGVLLLEHKILEVSHSSSDLCDGLLMLIVLVKLNY